MLRPHTLLALAAIGLFANACATQPKNPSTCSHGSKSSCCTTSAHGKAAKHP